MKNPLILREAAYYFHQHTGKTILIKFGGEIINGDNFNNLIFDIGILRTLNIKIVLVFGAGKQITELLQKENIPFEIIDGIRDTSKKAAEKINELSLELAEIIINKFRKIGIKCSYLPNIITSKKLNKNTYTADVSHVCSKKINKAFKNNEIIIMGPSHETSSGQVTNVNADKVALGIESKIKSHKFIFLSSTDGVLDEKGLLMPVLTEKEANTKIKEGTIKGGMKVKVQTCLDALKYTKRVHLISGVKDGTLLEELFTENGSGTLIVKNIKDAQDNVKDLN